MYDYLILIGIITFALIIWNLSISIQITRELRSRGIQARIAHRRGLIFNYLKIYKELTKEEEGQPGVLYRQFVISFTLFAIFLATGIILSAL